MTDDEFTIQTQKNTIMALDERCMLLEKLLDTYFHLPLGISEIEYERHKDDYDKFLNLVKRALVKI